MKNSTFCSCCDAPLPSPTSTSMYFQDATNGISTQIRKRLHRSPLNLPEVYFQMLDISIEKFPTFFGNTSKDAEQHLFKFKSTCEYVFNLTENNVTCRLFAQTLHGIAREWFFSLLPGTITSWNVLENSFAKNFIPRMHPYAPSSYFNVASHSLSLILTQNIEVSGLEEKLNQRLEKKNQDILLKIKMKIPIVKCKS
jgi:hypothetical protein